ncbi:MAG: cache domain-containing protein, partial [Dehalococcoidia bacterium]
MFFIRSLRAKTVFSALIPTALLMVAVAVIGLYAYERVSRDVVQQRDTELARVSAARLSEGLRQYSRILQNITAEEALQSLDPVQLSSALENAVNQLRVFDAGVVVYDNRGIALGSQPVAAQRQGTDFPVPSELNEVRRTLRPAFSNVFQHAISGDDVILVAVPILGRGNEFKGVLAGMFTIRYSLVGVTYAEVLEFKAGATGFAYLVDGNGRVIYHQDSSQVGQSLMSIEPVARATKGETGAVVTQDLTGESVISGFAPVPGTDWGVVTQERWENIVGPIRGWSKWLLAVLGAGGALSAALIFFAIGRILKPIKDLTRGAQRIAGGDFDHTIATKTGDEIQALGEQFNTMASALKESYAGLEQKVEARTRELRESEERLRTVVTGASIVLFALDKEGVFTLSEGQGLNALGLKPGEVVGRSAFDVYRDAPQIVENIRRALAGEEFTSTVEVDGLTVETRDSPLRGEKREIVGLIGVA